MWKTSFYLYLIASKGFSDEACLAGNTPVKRPIKAEKEIIKVKNGIGKLKRVIATPPKRVAAVLIKTLIIFPIPTPTPTPTTPPKKPKIIDSDKNNTIISVADAPIVRIIPISFVLSIKVTVMVLNIPIAETIKAIPPNKPNVA